MDKFTLLNIKKRKGVVDGIFCLRSPSPTLRCKSRFYQIIHQCHISRNLEMQRLPREMRISTGDDKSSNFWICDTNQIVLVLANITLTPLNKNIHLTN